MDLYNLLATASESKALRNVVDALSKVGLSSADLLMILDAMEPFSAEFTADISEINEDSPNLPFKEGVHIYYNPLCHAPCHKLKGGWKELGRRLEGRHGNGGRGCRRSLRKRRMWRPSNPGSEPTASSG